MPELPPDVLGEIDEIYERIQQATPEFYARPEQYRMMRELAATFLNKEINVTEGPTGVGKSLAYILPGSVVARKLKKKLVIATATVALQEQLVSRDIPQFIEKSGKDLRFGIAKGRGRYACTARLVRLGAAKGQAAGLVDNQVMNQQDSAFFSRLSEALQKGDWNGDRDSWNGAIPEQLWQTVTTDRHGCSKRRCDFFAPCPYYMSRNSLREADIIVSNQDVLLSDASLGGGYLLPKPEDTIYVIDEGHHLPHKTIQHFAGGVWLHAIEKWVERLPKVVNALAKLLKDQEIGLLAKGCMDEYIALGRAVSAFVISLSNYSPIQIANGPGGDADSPPYRFPRGILPQAFAEHAKDVRNKTESLVEMMVTLRNRAMEATEDGDVVALKTEPWLSSLGTLIGRIQKSINCWDLLLENSDNDSRPIAKWISVKEYQGKLDYHIEASRISPASILEEKLWTRAFSVAVTSATITVAGKFDHFARDSGLCNFPKVRYLKLNSPFDYAKKAELNIPLMTAIPGKDDSHTRELSEKLMQLINRDEATLVLFSSKKSMLEVLGQLPKDLLEKCLVQHQKSRQEILSQHAQRVGHGQGSVILGLQSFAEGLDLPGALCTHVVVTKIPFPMPDNPVDQAVAEWIEDRGGNAFIEQTVPQACIRLVQAVGRLIRREMDWGKVTILDRRIVDRNYGKMLLKSLPPMRLNIEHPRARHVA
ncbi:MAG: ATP-dependent DNA helicase DinG [Sulfuricaulis sp.]